MHKIPTKLWALLKSILPEDLREDVPLWKRDLDDLGDETTNSLVELLIALSASSGIALQRLLPAIETALRNYSAEHAPQLGRLEASSRVIEAALPRLVEHIRVTGEREMQVIAERGEMEDRLNLERAAHEKTMRSLLEKITISHTDLYENKITPILDTMLRVPKRIDAVVESQYRIHRLLVGVLCTMGVSAIFLLILIIRPS